MLSILKNDFQIVRLSSKAPSYSYSSIRIFQRCLPDRALPVLDSFNNQQTLKQEENPEQDNSYVIDLDVQQKIPVEIFKPGRNSDVFNSDEKDDCGGDAAVLPSRASISSVSAVFSGKICVCLLRFVGFIR